jgi:hypothetical protein
MLYNERDCSKANSLPLLDVAANTTIIYPSKNAAQTKKTYKDEDKK